MAQFMTIVDVAIVNVAPPSIQHALGFSPSDLQWVITAYTISFGGLLLLGGRLADLQGRRLVFMSGLLLFTVASAFNGAAWSGTALIIGRAAQGVGAAMLVPGALSLLVTTFPEGRERTLALGIWSAASAAGGSFGLLLGGALTSDLSWRWIFLVNVPIGAIVLALSARFLSEGRVPLGERRFDVAGAASITTGLMMLVYATTRATAEGWGATQTIVLLVASAVLIITFGVIEWRTRGPLLPLRLLRRRTLAGSNLSGIFAGVSGRCVFLGHALHAARAPFLTDHHRRQLPGPDPVGCPQRRHRAVADRPRRDPAACAGGVRAPARSGSHGWLRSPRPGTIGPTSSAPSWCSGSDLARSMSASRSERRRASPPMRPGSRRD
jgi:MFS family permease